MPNPFLLMAVFYLVVAVVIALDAVLTSFNLIPWLVGLPWLRVHFITLGVLVQAAFGALPDLAATWRGAPATRWDIWLLLNAGLVLLLAGVPSINPTLIIAGGVLTFAAASLLMLQLRAIGGPAPGSGSLAERRHRAGCAAPVSRMSGADAQASDAGSVADRWHA